MPAMSRLYANLLWIVALGSVAGLMFGLYAVVRYQIESHRQPAVHESR